MNKKFFRNIGLCFFLIVTMLFFAGCGASSTGGTSNGNDETITITAASAWTESDEVLNGYLWVYQQKLEDLTDGRLKLQFIGGPEAFPPSELSEAVRDGAVDFAWTTPAYQAGTVPEGNVFYYTEFNWDEMRENGALDYINEIQKKRLNSIILGGNSVGLRFGMYTKKRVESIEDFKGLRIRSSPSYIPFVRLLGAEPILLSGGEIYTSLERNVIDGFTWTSIGITELQLHEQVNYSVLPYYWMAQQFNIINADTWNALPDWAKDAFIQAQKEIEAELPAHFEKMEAKEREIIEAAGVTYITINDQDKYLDLANSGGWEYLKETVTEDPDKLIEMFTP